MSPEERRRFLGDAVIQQIHDEVREAPAPPAEVLDALRPILTSHRLAPAAPQHADAQAA
ncbi:hypothetical protein ACF1DY_01710 [Streptomyces albus]